VKLPSLLILADRGHFLAYSVASTSRGASVKLMVSTELTEAQERLGEKLTDKAGSFPVVGTGVHANSSAERMSLSAELESRTFRDIAKKIEAIVNEKQPESWAFAAPSEINSAILDGLGARTHQRLIQNLRRDLTRVPPREMLERFTSATSAGTR